MNKKVISPCISICRTDPVLVIVMVAQELMKRKNFGKTRVPKMSGKNKT